MTSPVTPRAISEVAEQIAEHAVGIVGGAADHQNIAGLALLDRDMDHPVVAGMRQHSHRGARGLARPPIPGGDKASSARSGHRPRARSTTPSAPSRLTTRHRRA